MPNEAAILYRTFIKRGMSKEDAFFAVIDHFNRLHWHDRDQYGGRIDRVEKRLSNLEKVDE